MIFFKRVNKKIQPYLSSKKVTIVDSMTQKKFFVEDTDNPPFIEIKDKYSLDINRFSRISDSIVGASIGSVEVFEKVTKIKANDHLVHCFFDLYLCLNSNLFKYESVLASAIIDGIHFKYFGQPVRKIITNSIELLEKPEKCFLNSLFKIVNGKDFPRLAALFAYYCIYEKIIGASEGISVAHAIVEIVKVVSPKLKKEISNILYM